MPVTLAAAQPWYNLPILGPYGIAVSALTTTAQQVIGADTGRNGIIFHNPGAQNKRVLPVGVSLAGGAGGILIYPQETYTLLKDETAQWNINCAWQAVTDNNADGALTVLNFTPSTPGAAEVVPTIRTNMANPITSPVAYEVTGIGAGSVLAVAADPNRTGIIFHNPGTNNLAVSPSNLAASIGAGSIIILPGAEVRIIGNDSVRVNCGWNVIAQSGVNNELTALGLYG